MGRYASPISKDAHYARVDQGVDWSQDQPYRAVGAGRITHVSKGWVGGTGDGIYLKLDHPITVNGRTYTEVYYAEQTPLVRKGQRVKAGQAVMKGGSAELGFSANGKPVAPLVGGLGAGTKPSQAGADFYTFVTGGQHSSQPQTQTQTPPVQNQDGTPGTPTTTDPSGANLNQQVNAGLQNIEQLPGAPLTSPPLIGDGEQPGPVSPAQVGQTWQLIAANGPVSPDTLRLASLASLASNGSTPQ